MHEMALAESIVSILEEQAAAQSYTRVRAVRLEVGPLAGVETQALRFCFDAVTRGTLAEGALLEFIDCEGRAWCMTCNKPVSITSRYDLCPECGDFQLQVTGGTELKIKDLEVE